MYVTYIGTKICTNWLWLKEDEDIWKIYTIYIESEKLYIIYIVMSFFCTQKTKQKLSASPFVWWFKIYRNVCELYWCWLVIPKINNFFVEFLHREISTTQQRFAALVALKVALHIGKKNLAYPKDFPCIPKKLCLHTQSELSVGHSIIHIYDGKFDCCLSSLFTLRCFYDKHMHLPRRRETFARQLSHPISDEKLECYVEHIFKSCVGLMFNYVICKMIPHLYASLSWQQLLRIAFLLWLQRSLLWLLLRNLQVEHRCDICKVSLKEEIMLKECICSCVCVCVLSSDCSLCLTINLDWYN